MPREFNVLATFNVKDLTTYVEDNKKLDLRPNPNQLGEDHVHYKDNRIEQE